MDGDDPATPLHLDRDRQMLAGALPVDWRGARDAAALHALFAHSPIATWIIDVELHRAFANRATAELFHLEPDPATAVADGMASLHPTERERTANEITAMLAGELDGVSRVKHYVRPDGTEFYGHLESRPLRDEGARPWAILSTCRDVTQQQEAERALVQREAWFEALVRHNVDAIIVVDDDATLTYASPSAEALGGMAVAEWIGRNALELVHPADFDIVAESFANTAATPGTAVPLRFRLRRSDGRVRFVEAIATNLLDDPAVRGIVVNLRDLTEREEVATALEVSENRFRKMLENISDTVTLLDGAGQVIRTTGNVKSILGYPTEFWTVRNAFDIAHPDDLDEIRRLFVALLENPGGDISGEFRVRAADGEFAYIEANAVNLLDDPEVGAIVVTTRNVTARKEAEQQVEDARDQALRALDVRNEFVASVSHELRTPIHGILGLAELLATSKDESEEVVQLAVSIRRATESLRLVLDDILDFTKIEAGRLSLNEQPVSLRELMDDLEALFGPQAAAKGIAVRVSADEQLPATLMADGLRLRQVLNNLLSNAVKFTSQGQVSVVFRRDTAVSGDRLRIQVTDTGIGMSPEIIQRVFEPFSQAHASTAREYGGTGLGLTIARRLIDMMDGVLLVDSEVGRGTAFDIDLPLRTRAQLDERAAEELISSGDRDGRRRVLVVEDNTVNQLLVGRQLERLGYEPIVVGSGEAGVETFGRERVDAVLMDWQMPGMDGLVAATHLRHIEKTEGRERVPIIAMTASAMPGDRERCLAAGMDDFVAKPVNLATLGRTLAAWLYPAEADGEPTPAMGARPAPPTGPVDSGVLDRLLEELDDPALVATVVSTYRRELPGRVESIEDAARAGDLGELKAVAHTLKSTSAALGADVLAELCRELEAVAKSETPVVGSLEPLLARVGAERSRVDAALELEGARFTALAASAS